MAAFTIFTLLCSAVETLRRPDLKRLVLASCLFVLLAFTAAYYGLPHLFKQPLLELNRQLSGMTEKTLQVDGHRIHYLDGGNGDPVILLHGIFAEKDHWVDFARQLTGSYRVIAPDLPGFGESDRLDGQTYGYMEQTQRLKDFMDASGIGRAHLAGNSMGGTIAAVFALRYPESVASVAFIGAPHGLRTPKPSEMDTLIDAGKSPLVVHDAAQFEEMMSMVFEKKPFLPYPILHAAQADALRMAPSNLQLWNEQRKDRYLLAERIGDLRAPILALWGSEDRLFDVSGVDVLNSSLKNPQVEVLLGIGHLPMMEAPRKTSLRYLGFLQGLPL